MTDMKCSICGKFGIYWKNLHTIGSAIESHYTYCPHCEGVNCQEMEGVANMESEANDTE